MAHRILFITNRNILTTCGELRLIKNRAEKLYEAYGISTDIIALASPQRIRSDKKEKINANGDLQLIEQDRCRIITIFTANLQLQKNIIGFLNKHSYDAVILSGAGIAYYAGLIKRIDKNILVYADIHGACEDSLEISKGCSLLKQLFYRAIYFLDYYGLRKSAKYIDGYFVVTRSLREYIDERFRVSKDTSFFIVPCATANANDHYFDNYDLYRKTYREKYGIKDSRKVFIYSGGTSVWQCLNETINLYKKIKKEIIDSQLLIFSHNHDEILKLVGNEKDIIVDSYQPTELSKALCAGDFAFLIRRDCVTNNVAFPNKFLEYVQSRMKIISTPFVFEIADQINRYDLGVIYDFTDTSKVITYIKQAKLNDIKIVRKILDECRFENRLKPFV